MGERHLLERGMHGAGFHNGGPALGVELQDPVEVAAEVNDDPAADRVSGQGRAGAA